MKSLHINIVLCLISFFAKAQDKSLKLAEKKMYTAPEEAIKLVNASFAGNLEQGEKLRALSILSNSYNTLNQKTKALQYCNEGILLARKIDDKTILIRLLGLGGNLNQYFRFNDQTKIYLNEAEALIKKGYLPDSLSHIKASLFYLKGMNYIYSLDSELAATYFDQAIKEYKRSKIPIAAVNIKLAYLNKGFCLLELKQSDDALKNFHLAQVNTKKREQLAKYPENFIQRQKIYTDLGISQVYYQQGKYLLSNELLSKISGNTDGIPEDALQEILYQHSKNYLALDDVDSSAYYRTLSEEINLADQKNYAGQISKLSEVENQISKRNNAGFFKKHSFVIISFTLLFAIMCAFLLLRNYKYSVQLKKEINESLSR